MVDERRRRTDRCAAWQDGCGDLHHSPARFGVGPSAARRARRRLAWPRRPSAPLGGLPDVNGQQVIEAVRRAGLLGRGGAGFPTGRKMLTVATGRGPKVVVANGAEGEPASAKDALLLTRAPHLVLDGVQLAARAVAADHASPRGPRGRRACPPSTPRSPNGTTRYLWPCANCPPRTSPARRRALVHWLNGGEAKPTFTPPRPFESGVKGGPRWSTTSETLAHVATIARCGPDWFRGVGDPDEPGTLLVTVSGTHDPAAGRRGRHRHPRSARSFRPAACPRGRAPACSSAGTSAPGSPQTSPRRLPLSHRALQRRGRRARGRRPRRPAWRDALRRSRRRARVAAYLAANNAGQCGPCLNGLPAIAGTLDSSRAAAPGTTAGGRASERWMSVVPGRGACRHPDGAVRFVVQRLSVFAADVRRHRTRGPCAALPPRARFFHCPRRA